jgi:hypothetical protein
VAMTSLTRTRIGILLVLCLTLVGFRMVGQTAAPPLEASGQFPALSSNSTNAAFALAEGRTTTAPSNLVSMGFPGSKFRGLEVVFYAVGDDNDVANYKIFAVNRGTSGPASSTTVDYCRRLFVSGTATFGTQFGVVSANGIKTTERIADAITLTVEPYALDAYVAFGGVKPRVYTPAANGEAVLWIPDGGNCDDFEFEFEVGTATSVNALVRRHR